MLLFLLWPPAVKQFLILITKSLRDLTTTTTTTSTTTTTTATATTTTTTDGIRSILYRFLGPFRNSLEILGISTDSLRIIHVISHFRAFDLINQAAL